MKEAITPVRCGALLVLFAITAPATLAAMMASGLSFGPAALVTAGAGVIASKLLTPMLPLEMPGTRTGERVLFLIWIGLGLFAGYRVAHLSVFMYDVERTEYAFGPAAREIDDPELAKPFYPTHDCFTCYIVASHLATEGVDNLYDGKFFGKGEVKTPIHQQIGDSLHVDTYQYPPPFLLLPRLLSTTGGDFYQLRTYWFALSILLFTVTVMTLALWVSQRQFSAYWLALPAILLSPVMTGTLQIQNVHLLVIAISALALPAFHKRYEWLGGALLGFAIVSKLFPGLLLVFLLMQKRWRAVCWTCGWMAAYCLTTALLFGLQPFEAFLSYQLPRLVSGEAFSFATAYLAPLVKNGSILGIPHKLTTLGLLANPAGVARVLVWAYTAAIVAVVLVAGRRRYVWRSDDTVNFSGDWRVRLVRFWIVLLILGQLRSPFLPWSYGNVAPLLLLVFLVPARWKTMRDVWQTALLVAAWSAMALTVPLPFGPQSVTFDLTYTLGALAVVLVCCTAVIVTRPSCPAKVSSPAHGDPPVTKRDSE
jgi:alpha-1,2-mannosyltransferase